MESLLVTISDQSAYTSVYIFFSIDGMKMNFDRSRQLFFFSIFFFSILLCPVTTEHFFVQKCFLDLLQRTNEKEVLFIFKVVLPDTVFVGRAVTVSIDVVIYWKYIISIYICTSVDIQKRAIKSYSLM